MLGVQTRQKDRDVVSALSSGRPDPTIICLYVCLSVSICVCVYQSIFWHYDRLLTPRRVAEMKIMNINKELRRLALLCFACVICDNGIARRRQGWYAGHGRKEIRGGMLQSRCQVVGKPHQDKSCRHSNGFSCWVGTFFSFSCLDWLVVNFPFFACLLL